jgi:hypothetical protein
MSGDNLLEKMVDFCLTFNIDERELGDILETSKEFKLMLYKDCVQSNIIQDEYLKKQLERSEKLEEW